jgi:hypothetical protein
MFCASRAPFLRAGLLVAVLIALTLTASATAAQAAPLYGATTDSAPLTAVDTTTATQLFGPQADDQMVEIAPPFAIALYGGTYDMLTVSTNGYVGMGAGTEQHLGSGDASVFGTPIVSAFNADLYTGDDGGVYAETRGTAPNRQFVIQWDVNVCCSGGAVLARFQVILTEGSETVESRYEGTNESTGWVGVKHDPSQLTHPGTDEQSAYPAPATRITYTPVSVATAARSNQTPTFTGTTPDPSTDVAINLHPGTDTTVAPLRTLTVTPNASGDYSVTLPAADRLGGGDYTAQATQTAAGVTAKSLPRTFTIDATAPNPTLTAPANGTQTAETKPVFGGNGGTAPGDKPEVAIGIYAGDTAVQTLMATLAGDGSFAVRPAADLAPGQYAARVTQTDDVGNTAIGAPVTFAVQAAVAPVCKSRRVFVKHLRRPSGSQLRVVATLNGRKARTKVRRHQIVIPVDLRGKLKGTYRLRVRITRTLKSGKTVTRVERFAYRTCA